jgi:hypothetical protein
LLLWKNAIHFLVKKGLGLFLTKLFLSF